MLPRFPFHARDQPVNVRIGLNFGAVKVEFLTPDQPGLAAQFDNPFKELLKGGEAIAFADLGQTAVIRDGLEQIADQVMA